MKEGKVLITPMILVAVLCLIGLIAGLIYGIGYSDEKSKFNCERFCKQFGGGGHVHASGFSIDKPVMFDMGTVQPIQNKK